MSEVKEEEIKELAVELQGLLENHLLEDPASAHPYIVRALEIKKIITQYGYLVTWQASLNPETFELDVTVNVYKPKADMSAENQALYDKWFLEANRPKCEYSPDHLSE